VRPGAVRDGFRLSFGTLTLVPVPAPATVDRAAAGVAMSVAVLPGATLGLVAGTVLTGLVLLGVPSLVAAAAAVGTSTLLTRFMHVDGLADTTDGLVASWDRDRALEVMRRGDVGPSGATVLVLVLLAQVAALAAVADAALPDDALPDDAGPVTVVVGTVVLAWATSRAVLAVLTARGTTPAREGGLGAGVIGSVPVPVAVAVPLLLALVGLLTMGPVGALAVGAGVLAAGALAVHASHRLGGLTGDVLGAGVEVALLAALVVLTAG
jgi:adenosylcobinamide-GDP ribazoletransferase